MALKKEFSGSDERNNTFCDYLGAYHIPLNISINIDKEIVLVQMGVYAHEDARKAAKDGDAVDFVDQYKEVFTFKEFGLTKKRLVDSAYKCLKKLDEFKDAEDI